MLGTYSRSGERKLLLDAIERAIIRENNFSKTIDNPNQSLTVTVKFDKHNKDGGKLNVLDNL